LFQETIKLAYDIFGEMAFYLYRNRKTGWSWYERPTTAVYDPMMMALSKRINAKTTLVSKRHLILEKLQNSIKLITKALREEIQTQQPFRSEMESLICFLTSLFE